MGVFLPLGGKTAPHDAWLLASANLDGARDAWRDAREKLSKGEEPAAAPALFSDLFRDVLADRLKRDQSTNRSHDEVKRILHKEALPVWKQRRIAEITRRQIMELIDGIADRGTVTLARRCHAHLHRLFRWSVGRGIIETSPMACLPKPGAEVKRKRVLSDEELGLAWGAAQEIGWPMGSAIQLLILTCARRDEIGDLQWWEIDGARAKGKLDELMLSRLKARERGNGGREIELKPWRIHDLRRTVATGMERLGVKQQVVEALLEHTAGSKAGITGIYQLHTYEEEKRDAIDKWTKHVASHIRTRRRRDIREPELLAS